MTKLESRINQIFKTIPDSERKYEVKQEIMMNLSEKVNDLMSKGMSEDDALSTAMEDFGDIGELTSELQESGRQYKEKKTWLALGFSIWGSILLVALFLFANFYYTPKLHWFIFPVFVTLWWPLALFCKWRSLRFNVPFATLFSIIGASLIILLVILTNFHFSPSVYWFVYPIFAVLWWPISVIFGQRRRAEKNRGENDV